MPSYHQTGARANVRLTGCRGQGPFHHALVVGQADIHADITPVRLHPYVSERLSRAPLNLVSSSIRRPGYGFGSFSRKLPNTD